MTRTGWIKACVAGFAGGTLGRALIGLKDVDGKPFVAERVELGRARPDFRQDCRFTNLVSRKVEPEQMYCERLDETVVCGGVHKN